MIRSSMHSPGLLAFAIATMAWVSVGTEARAGLPEDLVISELLASNRSGIEDEDGDASDWIEICNRSGGDVDLAGWAIVDDRGEPWVFPERVLSPGDYLVVFASGKDRSPAFGELHASFSLRSAGEHLALVRPNGELAHEFAPSYPPQREDISYGLGRPDAPEPIDGGLSWLVPVPGDADLEWTAIEFDDSSWSHAPSGTRAALPLGYEADGEVEGVSVYAAIVRASDRLGAYWRLGDSEPDAAADETGRYPGEYQGDVSLGAAGALVGDDDPAAELAGGYLDISDAGDLTAIGESISIEAWVKPLSGGSFQWITAKGSSASATDFLLGITSADQFRFITQGLANVLTSPATYTFDGDTWFHVVGIQDLAAESLALYVNGDLVAAAELEERGVEPSSLLRIGDRPFGTSQRYRGGLDEVAIYRRALGPAEIADHFAAGIEPRGFDEIVRTDVETELRGVSSSLYARFTFEIDDPGGLESLLVHLRYDDGCALYLNGREVVRRNAPAVLDSSSAAESDRPRLDALRVETIDIGGHLDALVPGRNVLGVHALNDGPDSPDFLLDIGLEPRETSRRLYFPRPTPGAPNGPGLFGFVGDTRFTVDRGFFSEPFEVEIESDTNGAAIHFSLDGSDPRGPAASLYTGPITITGTTVLRACATRPGFFPTNVDTQTYLFPEEVIEQTGAGFPASWNGTRPDYAMDPNVVDDARYSDRLAHDLQAIPTVSVVAPVEDLFGPEGVYSNPTQRGRAWERECSVELFGDAGPGEFQIDAGLRAHGGSSRDPSITPQHSLRLHFRSEYGAPKLDFALFDDSSVDRFDTLVLSASSSDNWTSANLATGQNAQFIRDQWARDVHRDMGHEHVAGIFVHLYLNGLYWGLYNLVERVDESFAAEHFGGDSEDYDVIIDRAAFSGDTRAWSTLIQRVRANDYPGVTELLDVDNFIDYMLVNMFTGNWDWPDHNWHAVRRRALDEKFRFVVWDAEVGLGLDVNIPGPIRPNVLTVDLTGSRADVSASALANGPGEIYNRFRGHADFRVRFADRLQQHIVDGGVLAPENAIELYGRRTDEIFAALHGESARWGDVRREPPDVPDGRWESQRRWIVETFFPRRPDIVLDQFRRRGLYPPLPPPSLSLPEGSVAPGTEITITAPNATVVFTTDGTDPRLPGGEVSPDAVEGEGSAAFVVEAPARVFARARDGNSWSARRDALYFFDLGVRITEILYHPAEPPDDSPWLEDAFEFVEVANMTGAEFNLEGLRIDGGIRFEFPARVLDPGEAVVVVHNEEAFGERYPDALGAVVGEFDGRLSNGGETLILFGPVDEPLLEFEYDDEWYAITDGPGFSLIAEDPGGPASAWGDEDAWRPSAAIGGTPGVVDADPEDAGTQIPGDTNQDGGLNIADALRLIRDLFGGGPVLATPCGDALITEGASALVADVNGDASVDISDVISILNFLFGDGRPPALGVECVRIPGCPDLCAP